MKPAHADTRLTGSDAGPQIELKERLKTERRRERRRRLLNWGSWLYCAALVGLMILLRSGSDQWWPVTVMMFGPRWLSAMPLLVLGPLAVWTSRKALWPLAVGLAVILGPLMGFCIPWRAVTASQSSAGRIRVLSCNTHHSQLEAPALSLLIIETQPDIVALQGWTGQDQPIVFLEKNWHIRRDRELCLGSRFPIRKAQESDDPLFHDGRGALARYELESPFGTIHLINLHLASPREALETVAVQPLEAESLIRTNSDLRRQQSAIAQMWAMEVNGPILLAGDFNTPPESTIYDQFWSPFHNAFAEGGLGWGYTFFTRRSAVRIDHQLGGPGWECRRCRVGPEVGSPHRPLIADWYWTDSMKPTPP